MSSVSPIGIPNALGILKNDGTGLLTWTTIQPGRNAIINGDCRVNQRVTAYTLIKDAYPWDTSDLYGPDRHEGMATGTAVSAGTWGQTVTATAGNSGYAFTFAGVTLTGTGILYHRHRIEAKDAVEFKNQICSFGCSVYQDTGSAIPYTIYIRKANAADNFSAVTAISNSGAISVPSGAKTALKYENISLGDCSNGIEIEIVIECGAVTTKNFEQTELQFEKGSVCTAFEIKSILEELSSCSRYFTSLFFATGGAGEMIGIAFNTQGLVTAKTFPSPMRAVPTVTIFATGGDNHVRTTATGADVTIVTPSYAGLSNTGLSWWFDSGSAPFTSGAAYDWGARFVSEL